MATAVSAAVPAPGVDSQAASSWQTNNTVWALAYWPQGNAVFVGGQFTDVRPPGAAAGTSQTARTYLAEFNASTGALVTSFDPSITANSSSGKSPGVYALAVSPDGRTLYVGGAFSHVGGRYRNNVAAVSTATGALTSWAPQASSKVMALAVSPDSSTVYVGGDFSLLGGAGRTYAGAVSSAGALLPWQPVLSNSVTSIALDSSGTSVQQVLIGGYFQTLNGTAENAVGAVDPVSGTVNESWSASIVPYDPAGHCTSAVKAIVISSGVAYIGAEGTGGGCFDGDFAVSLGSSGDSLLWQNDCLGATQALAVVDGYLFKGSHAHNCSFAPDGFPQDPPVSTGHHVTYHLLDQSLSDGGLEHWTPTTDATLLGPRVMATDGSQLFVGGDFTTVNGKTQQGFARFAAGLERYVPAAPRAPAVTSSWAGKVTVSFTAVSTPQIGRLTYTIYRTGQSAPVGTVTATSWPWAKPKVHYIVSKLRAGSKVSFSVTANDGLKTSARSRTSATVTVARKNPAGSYQSDLLGMQPSFDWPLNETSGSVAADASSHHFNGVYESGTTQGVPGPLTTSNATSTQFNGSDGLVTAANAETSPATFSVAAWVKTTTDTGGLIAGFDSAQTGLGSKYDRQLYMMNDGQIAFGVDHTSAQAILTGNSYNDGHWHFVVGTFRAGGTGNMVLYVDGVEIGSLTVGNLQSYTGYWHVGGGNLAGHWNLSPQLTNSQGTTEPNSFYLNGSEGDVAVFPAALSATQVDQLYHAAGM